MNFKIAFDVSGLAWKYKTGVQNLYWAYIQAYLENSSYLENCELLFYDRSGLHNDAISGLIGHNYLSMAPKWLPKILRRPLQLALRSGVVSGPSLSGYINQVWNWDIYNPSQAHGSITIPDTLPLEYPQWFSSRFRKLTEKSLVFAQNEAEYIFCISEYVKNRVIEHSGIAENRVHVAYPGIDAKYFEILPSSVKSQILNKYKLTKNEYLLSTGFIDPRKNLKRQVEAFGLFAEKTNTPLKYALTGLKTALSDELLALIARPSLRDRVVFLGYVPAAELRVLTSEAACLMYCSIAEGFGLPIIEAMASGVPVITSKSTSMEELAAGKTRLVMPEDVDDITDAINWVVNLSNHEKNNMLDENRLFARRFTIAQWMKSHIEVMTGNLGLPKHLSVI